MDSLKGIQDYIFSPIDNSQCTYPYILMVVSFVSLVFNIMTLVGVSVTSKRMKFLWQRVIVAFIMGILLYHHNRLFYSICVRSYV